MNLLELFSGTGSVGRVARDLGLQRDFLGFEKMLTSTLISWNGTINSLMWVRLM